MKQHTFHIPVMGIGFTIDTPLKVAHLGIDSVISLVDDMLIEKMRKFYCEQKKLPYVAIMKSDIDHRAKRITSYLNLIQDLAEQKFEEFKSSTLSKADEIKNFFQHLPDGARIKHDFFSLISKNVGMAEIRTFVNENLTPGSIDVNIMTKVDKDNYHKNEKLPVEFNDAHAALRGFANSKLNSSIVLSAGLNMRLFSYFETFDDFFPDKTGKLKKKVILKVSDYRSALVQGKILAKKGIWISEFRIESGLNCGGHAFATEGHLLGPILHEFKTNKTELTKTLHDIWISALAAKEKFIPKHIPTIKFSAQGGLGTNNEHEFLLDHFDLDSIGWGSPFMLAPDVTNVDNTTLRMLEDAEEKDLFLSDISPLGIPFNSLAGNTKDKEKKARIDKGRPGSSCPKKYVSLNKEFNETGMCTASREYQHLKIKELDAAQLSAEEYNKRYENIVVKSCTCVGLGTSALLINNIETRIEGTGVSACPGPNLAYFSKRTNLEELMNHIYGRINLISRTDRPNLFIKELQIYIDFLSNKLIDARTDFNAKQEKYFTSFIENLNSGIIYYRELFTTFSNKMGDAKEQLLNELSICKSNLERLHTELQGFKNVAVG